MLTHLHMFVYTLAGKTPWSTRKVGHRDCSHAAPDAGLRPLPTAHSLGFQHDSVVQGLGWPCVVTVQLRELLDLCA